MNANKDFEAFLRQKLDERAEAGLLRKLIVADGLVDFCSNDYLGFAWARLPTIEPDTHLPPGSTGSRLISGNSKLAEQTEKKIASFHNAASALIFNSGYDANLGLLSCIASKDDTIITDELVHASIIDGVRLSYASRLKFKHNDPADLEKKLQLAKGKKIVVIESIYSMDGDEAPLENIAKLCKRHGAILIIDEAHATGLYGDSGEGLVCKYELEKEVFARIITFGKALGLHGAAILGSSTLKQFLVNHSRSFIYTTALPPHTYLQIQKAYQLLPHAARDLLFELVEYFRSAANRFPNITISQSYSPIQAVFVKGNHHAKALSDYLGTHAFFVKAILSPTVPAGTERLRICLHTFNTKAQIDGLLNAIADYKE